MGAKLELICNNCGIKFSRETKEYKNSIKRGRKKVFCSRSCCISKSNSERPRQQLTEDSPFLYFLKNARKKKNKHQCIDVEMLRKLWNKQNGICKLTGEKLILPVSTAGFKNGKQPFNASLDRINNSKGYIKGNIRFVAYIANIARSDFSDEILINFCKLVAIKNETR